MADTLVRLGVKTRQPEQALQGLSRTYAIRGTTARAYTFLYGNERPTPSGPRRGSACEGSCAVTRRKSSADLAAEKLGEFDEELPRHDLTTVSLDDPRQWSMSWTTLPDVYSIGLPQLDK